MPTPIHIFVALVFSDMNMGRSWNVLWHFVYCKYFVVDFHVLRCIFSDGNVFNFVHEYM